MGYPVCWIYGYAILSLILNIDRKTTDQGKSTASSSPTITTLATKQSPLPTASSTSAIDCGSAIWQLRPDSERQCQCCRLTQLEEMRCATAHQTAAQGTSNTQGLRPAPVGSSLSSAPALSTIAAIVTIKDQRPEGAAAQTVVPSTPRIQIGVRNGSPSLPA